MTGRVKGKSKEYNKLMKQYCKNDTNFKKLLTKSSKYIEIKLEGKKMNKKLNHLQRAPNTYWRMLNPFSNNNNVPSIYPLLVNGEIISNSKQAEILNIFWHHLT